MTKNNEIVLMLSGGRTSFECLLRLKERGLNVVPLFADTKTEDEDLYRFLCDIERVLQVEIIRIADGRNIWQVFRDRRYIGNSMRDPCSKVLKRDLCRAWLRENKPEATVAFGLDWTEPHRIAPVRARWNADGFECVFPLTDKPYLLEGEYDSRIRELGIVLPRLYALGFQHNNCGGGCVKGGQAQWAHLLAALPERYAWHESEEEATRLLLGKDVSILKDRRGSETNPLTLAEFRQRIESGQKAGDDLFSCNCFSESDDNV